MECMSNACEHAGIRNALFNTSDDQAQVAEKGAYGTNYVIAQWVQSSRLVRRLCNWYHDGESAEPLMGTMHYSRST